MRTFLIRSRNRTKLLRIPWEILQRPPSGGDRVVGRRAKDDAIAEILDRNGLRAPASPNVCGKRDLSSRRDFVEPHDDDLIIVKIDGDIVSLEQAQLHSGVGRDEDRRDRLGRRDLSPEQLRDPSEV